MTRAAMRSGASLCTPVGVLRFALMTISISSRCNERIVWSLIGEQMEISGSHRIHRSVDWATDRDVPRSTAAVGRVTN
jgi:hypothetical protein